ncbi:MAG: hypothetical protein DLM52_04395 [Chthoniobacterales bacterium]|nr:MAG: hypothetical protein DLM52_04395 [Chthoniobacterales bacterium]
MSYPPPPITRYLGGAWSMHLPFAWDLMSELKPSVFVELGVYRGESYFAFCQSVQENRLSTKCYGVDTWHGDVHSGMYGPEIGREVEAYNARYSSFSKLFRMTFNEALSHFAEASIDLLHIDGAHRYEDVKHDFQSWLPKVSAEGLILFHDVTMRERGFGVWRLWKEIADSKTSFVFEFGHGLGVWKKTAVSEKTPSFVKKLCLADEAERREIVNHYAAIATAMASQEEKVSLSDIPVVTSLQIYPRSDRTFDQGSLSGCDFTASKWQHLRVPLLNSDGFGSAPLRFDPGNEVGVIEIARIIIRSEDRTTLWRAKGPSELSCLVVGGTAVVVPHDRVFRILNLGSDPQVLVPAFQATDVKGTGEFDIWLRLDTSRETLAACFTDFRRQQQHEIEQQQLALATKLQDKEAERAALEKALHEHQAELAAFNSEVERLERELWEHRVRRADYAARLKERDDWISEVKKSVAWKAAKPLWKAQRHFSRRKAAPLATRHISEELVFGLDNAGVWNATRDSIELTGWCFTRGGPQIVGVRTKIGGKSYFARYGLKREDVAQTAGGDPAALYCGFSLTLPAASTSTTVRLEAIAQNGPWRVFLEKALAGLTSTDGPGSSARARGPELRTAEQIVLPLHPNGRQPVLYPGATADQAAALLAPLIKQPVDRVAGGTPLFSIITPVFNTAPRWLIEAAASLLSQSLPEWEWCVVDDGSSNAETQRTLESLASAHPRVQVKHMTRSGISGATNQALEMASGEFVCFLDHDDLLHPAALELLREKIGDEFDVLYSDEDKLDEEHGILIEPFFKPDWSPEYFRGAMYVGHLLCVRRALARQVRFDSDFDGVQDFEFMLRVSETGARIGHIPKILYHWRKTPGSIAANAHAKPRAALLQQKAVNAHLKRLGLRAEAKIGSTPHRLKIVPEPRSTFPKVSIVIPTRDAPDLLSKCLKSLYDNTGYPDFEVLLIDNDTTSSEAIELMRKYPLKRFYLPNPFNFSRANNLGAQNATGEYLIFLNNDTEIISGQWIEQLLYYAEQPDVGAVGALLLHENGAVQHAGVILGMRGTADHAMRGFRAKSDGYAGSLSCAREVSAVTAACMMMRKSLFHDVGGFNEHFFTIYQDVDLCLRLRQRGLRIIWTPQALLLHHESLSRQTYYDFVDRNLLLDQWEDIIARGDPYYNKNLNAERGDYSLKPA